jgi:acyl carrier protein
MTEDVRRIRAAVLDALETVSGLRVAELSDSKALLDLNMDSLSLVAMLSLVEARCGTSLDAEATAEIMRAPDIGHLVAAIDRCVAARRST